MELILINGLYVCQSTENFKINVLKEIQEKYGIRIDSLTISAGPFMDWMKTQGYAKEIPLRRFETTIGIGHYPLVITFDIVGKDEDGKNKHGWVLNYKDKKYHLLYRKRNSIYVAMAGSVFETTEVKFVKSKNNKWTYIDFPEDRIESAIILEE